MRVFNKIRSFIIGFITFNFLWYIGYIMLDKPILVSPFEVYRNMADVFSNSMEIHLMTSLKRIIIGIIIALIIGIIIGTIMAYSKTIDKVLSPLIYFSYPVPKLAFLPVLMLLFGLGDGSKITMIVLILVFQVIVTVRDSIKKIPEDTYHCLYSLGASKIQILREVTFPAIFSEILTTTRIALGTAISVLFFTETYGTKFGMGYFIMDAWMRIDYIEMYAGIIILSIMGFILFILVDIIDEIFCPWNKE